MVRSPCGCLTYTCRRHRCPPISCHTIAMMWPSPMAIQPAHHCHLVPTTNGIPSPHPCFLVRTHAPYVHTNPHPPGFILLHPPPPFLHAYRHPSLMPTIAISPPPMHPSPHHPSHPPPIPALTSQDWPGPAEKLVLNWSGPVCAWTSFNLLIDRS